MERNQKQTFFMFLNQLDDDARDSYLPMISKKRECVGVKWNSTFLKDVKWLIK